MSGSSWIPYIDTGEPGWILSSTARDMARFGLLALNRGRWNGVPILADSAWFASSWRGTPPDNAGYGLLWWLNGSTNYRPPGAVSAPLAISAFDEQWWRRLKPAFRYESAPCATCSICSTTVVGATSRMHVQCPSGQPWPPCALHGRQGSSSRPSTT